VVVLETQEENVVVLDEHVTPPPTKQSPPIKLFPIFVNHKNKNIVPEKEEKDGEDKENVPPMSAKTVIFF
jgi:hypothetical protein